ncbi:MAG: hypothetical protein AMK74_03355 [Nitrospira bacterium SM23_35]|jgi:radical SAM modification target selenobiotic family peptide|nr:MAG: hypothetical protein AMK74_03355 [Nitrospira bacterium SM23_35]
MNKQDFKKILAGLSVAGLLTGVSFGCKTEQQPPPAGQDKAPAQTETTTAPAKEAPAPSS